MGGFKRLCLAVWSLAGVFTLAALGLTWVGPWTDVASALMVINEYWIALEVCFCITAVGLVVTLLRALFLAASRPSRSPPSTAGSSPSRARPLRPRPPTSWRPTAPAPPPA